jgi:hypothetical protein
VPSTVRPSSSTPALNEDLRRELRTMARADSEGTEAFPPANPGDPWAAWEASTRGKNVARLREIIQDYGWPGNSLVGRDGARAAWLIAQHADFDRAFQRQSLALIAEAYDRGDVDGHDLAYLTDRVAAAEGRRQVYFTQGVAAYDPGEEPEIDARRRGLGLPSMSEFRAMCARGEYSKIHDPGW